MKKISSLIFIIGVFILGSCSKNEDETPIDQQSKVFKADINGDVFNYTENSPNSIFFDAVLTNNKKLVITVQTDETTIGLTVGELFLDKTIQEGKYIIGTAQDDLETNLLYFDVNDTNTNGTQELYGGVYSCNVLSNSKVGEINIIKLDTENKIISGTFEGTLFRWIDPMLGNIKSINIKNGAFTLPYFDKTEQVNNNPDRISSRVDGYRFYVKNTDAPGSYRSTSSGIDKITVEGYDHNFGRIKISMLPDVEAGETYKYIPDGSFQSLGISFVNRIDFSEDLITNNPDQSNETFISIISHNKDLNTIEGNFYIENSKLPGRTITDGYFKVAYTDFVE